MAQLGCPRSFDREQALQRAMEVIFFRLRRNMRSLFDLTVLLKSYAATPRTHRGWI